MKKFNILILALLASSTLADVCNVIPHPDNLPIPIIPTDGQFQAVIEKNTDLGETREIHEYYDGKNNVGIASTYFANVKLQTYSYYPINELLTISGDNCIVMKLNESYGLTPFQVINVNGTEHIFSPLNALSPVPNVQFKYIGANNIIRGIPVKEWQACFYSVFINSTFKFTYSFSDDKKWAPAFPIEGFPSVPVQFVVEITKDGAEKSEVEYYSIFQFRKLLLLEEEDYFTPSGIFCPNRTNLKKAPKIPESFRFSNQLVTPIPNENNLLGTIETAYEEYNFKHKLFRYAYSQANSIVNEVHDYSTGLNYKFNKKFGTCEITKLTAAGIDSIRNGTYITIRNPNEFFDFDNADYQYVGLKRRDGINNDVWIGKRKLNGFDATLEWYFMSDVWNDTSNAQFKEKTPIPVYVKVTIDVPKPDNPKEITKIVTANHFFGFTQTYFNLADFDISTCDDKLTKKYFIFSLANDLAHLIKSNIPEFEHSLIKILLEKLRITALRMSHLQIVFDQDAIYVLFTLYERASFYGDVPVPIDDLLLEDAVKELKKSFLNDEIQIRFRSFDDNQEYVVPTVKASLTEIGAYDEGFVTINKVNIKAGFSSATLAVVTIVVTVVGLVFGLFLIVLQKSQKINLPFLKMFYSE